MRFRDQWLSLVFTAILSSQAAHSSPPSKIYATHNPSLPVWVSAEAAEQGGEVDWSLFSEADKRSLKGFLDQNGEDLNCSIFLSQPYVHRLNPKDNSTFSSLMNNAMAIYAGEITAVSPGFFGGLPSSLLTVRVGEVLRASKLIDVMELLVPYPVARFRIGRSTFCGGAPDSFIPTSGDQVVVFVYDPPLDRSRTLVSPLAQELLIETQGRLVLPKDLRLDDVLGKASSLTEVIDHIRGSEP